MPERHRLARKKKLRPRDFEGENFISLGPSTLSRFRIDGMFAEHGITRILRIETPLSEIACALAGADAGVVLCEPFTATEYATRGIVVRPFAGEGARVSIGEEEANDRLLQLARAFPH